MNARDFELLLKYFINLIKNNLRILKNPAIETTANARRGYVYSVDFGFTTGGVLRDRHYCVVLYSQGKTAIVVPLTSKNNLNIFNVELGIIIKIFIQRCVIYFRQELFKLWHFFKSHSNKLYKKFKFKMKFFWIFSQDFGNYFLLFL